MFIEAMADAAVAGGIAKEPGIYISAQAVLGSAKMVLRDRKASGRAQGYGVLTCRNHYPGCACA